MEPYWDLIKQIVKESDVILEILDARLVEISRNKEIERLIKERGRHRILVLNKADLISRKDLEFSIDQLRRETGDEVVYVSNRQTRTIKTLLAKIRQMFDKYGKREGFSSSNPILKKPYREAKSDIVVGVVGYPNVGKSSIINALCFKKKVNVSTKAGTTHGVHWINANEEIKLIDTPGVIPLENVDESNLGLIAARNPEKLKAPDVTAGKIIEFFVNENKVNKLEDFYNMKITDDGKKDSDAILHEIGKRRAHLKKGGLVDETRTSLMIVHDWQKGKLRL